jgi:hypothetical protein
MQKRCFKEGETVVADIGTFGSVFMIPGVVTKVRGGLPSDEECESSYVVRIESEKFSSLITRLEKEVENLKARLVTEQSSPTTATVPHDSVEEYLNYQPLKISTNKTKEMMRASTFISAGGKARRNNVSRRRTKSNRKR